MALSRGWGRVCGRDSLAGPEVPTGGNVVSPRRERRGQRSMPHIRLSTRAETLRVRLRGRAMTVVSQGTRVVISGLGVVSPIGIGAAPFWKSLCAGRSGVMYHSAFPDADIPSRFAAEVRDFIPEEHVSCKRLLKAMSRDIQLGVSAASQAMADAALQAGSVNPERLGVVFGSGRMTSTPQELADAAAHCCGVDGEFRHDLFD